MQKQAIHPVHRLLPDSDGTVIAAGPLVGGSGMMHNRTVLRRDKGDSYVVHTQQYPDVDTDNPQPFAEYHNGDYVGPDDRSAFVAFVRRLARQGEIALGLSREEMLP